MPPIGGEIALTEITPAGVSTRAVSRFDDQAATADEARHGSRPSRWWKKGLAKRWHRSGRGGWKFGWIGVDQWRCKHGGLSSVIASICL
jgi:hypothetical protein